MTESTEEEKKWKETLIYICIMHIVLVNTPKYTYTYMWWIEASRVGDRNGKALFGDKFLYPSTDFLCY